MPSPSTGTRGIQPGSALGRFLGALASAPGSGRVSEQPAGEGADAQIRITGGTGGELADLGEWLVHDRELHGRVRAEADPVGGAEPGAAIELLTVALGASGAVTALASSLRAWLMTRRPSVRVTVSSSGRSVTLDFQTAADADVVPVLEQFLEAPMTAEAGFSADDR